MIIAVASGKGGTGKTTVAVNLAVAVASQHPDDQAASTSASFDGTGPGGMGPMTGSGRGWCNPYSPFHAGYGLYPTAYPYAQRPHTAPVAVWPAWGYGLGRPRWGLRGFWGRGIGWGGRRRW